ncbi:hypothetical protein B0H19DRAFT_1267151 [Mycena capillaripes]|nr:hypothetical protein B0H19DRAFT_1276941 [Mycena capillaripes]KAJ6545787.1 hypothetical protein B0H19DRAFT_1267151 [Mycena capillaripes]
MRPLTNVSLTRSTPGRLSGSKALPSSLEGPPSRPDAFRSARPRTHARAASLRRDRAKMRPLTNKAPHRAPIRFGPPAHERARAQRHRVGLCQNVSFFNVPHCAPMRFGPPAHERARAQRHSVGAVSKCVLPQWSPIDPSCVSVRPPTNAWARSVAASGSGQNAPLTKKTPHQSPMRFSPPAHERARAQRRCVVAVNNIFVRRPPIDPRCVLARPPTNARARSVAASGYNIFVRRLPIDPRYVLARPPTNARARSVAASGSGQNAALTNVKGPPSILDALRSACPRTHARAASLGRDWAKMRPLTNKPSHRVPMRFGPPIQERMRARRCVRSDQIHPLTNVTLPSLLFWFPPSFVFLTSAFLLSFRPPPNARPSFSNCCTPYAIIPSLSPRPPSSPPPLPSALCLCLTPTEGLLVGLRTITAKKCVHPSSYSRFASR